MVGRLPPLLLCPGNFSGEHSLLNFGGVCVSGLSSLTKKHHKAPYHIYNQREFWSLDEMAKMDLQGGPRHQLLNVVITAPLIGVIPLVTHLSFGHFKGPCGGSF